MNGLNRILADTVPPPTFWNGVYGSGGLWLKIILAFLIVSVALVFLKDAGPRVRKYVVGGATFLAGAFYVFFYFYPTPLNRQPGEMPQNAGEAVSFWLDDAVPTVGQIANIVAAFLLGLGVYSVFTVHVKRVAKQSADWGFSVVLLLSFFLMVGLGYADWGMKRIAGPKLDDPSNWGIVNYGRSFLFDGLLQNMDAAMFSIISFYILSAAYRAFRIRSIEATILLGSAVIMMIGLLSGFEYGWNHVAHQLPTTGTYAMGELTKWLQDCFQTPSLRAIQWGLGIGTLAMGLRLWLSLEKQGAN